MEGNFNISPYGHPINEDKELAHLQTERYLPPPLSSTCNTIPVALARLIFFHFLF